MLSRKKQIVPLLPLDPDVNRTSGLSSTYYSQKFTYGLSRFLHRWSSMAHGLGRRQFHQAG